MRKFTTRFLPFFLIAIFCLGLNSFAQVQETVSVTGHLVRTTPKLADLDLNSMYGEPFVITRDMNGKIGRPAELKVTKAKLEQQFTSSSGGTSEAVQKPGTIFPNVPGTTLGAGWNGGTSPGLTPTDNNIAVGPSHVIQMTNHVSGSEFRIWNKAGGVIQGPTVLASLTGFSGSGDPVVLYDQLADRWLMSEFGPSACCSELIIAVSTTSNPTGTWSIYRYVDASFFPDYPKYSIWHNAYYATTNDFNSSGTAYLGSSVWSFDRAAMLAGNPTATMIRTRLTAGGNPYYNMNTIGLEGMTPSTQNGLFAYPVAPTTLNVFEVTPNFGAATQVVGAPTALTIASYSAPPSSVAQQGTGSTIQTLGQRLMFKLNYRNNSGTESIVITHTVGNGGLAAVRWYELRRVAGTWTVYQQGTVTGSDGNSRFMGGISMDGCGNIALMYDLSGTTSFPSVKYTGRNASDPLGTMTLPEATIINGSTFWGSSRWGDYNTTVQDYTAPGVPNNGSFWSASEYSNQQTRIANYTLTGGCAAAPNITAGTATLTAEGCVPNNAVIDPGETVTVDFCALNVGTANTTNLVGTMQVSGGVTPISGPQNYGVLTFGGPAVCRSFSFSNTSGTCGATITVTIQWQDGATNLGSSTWTFTLGTTVVTSSENFDAVVAPALPAGWVATNAAGPAPLWVTSTSTPFSAPNAAFVDDPAVVADKILVTPSFTPGGGSRVSFRNNYSLENGFDGGVLEISINGGGYQDIVAAGGSFVTGGYTGTISSSFGNPLGGRSAWTGSSGGYIQTIANLPNAANGQPCQLRFRMGSDNSVSAVGWRVDDFSISQPSCCGAVCTITCPANMTVNTGPGATSCGTIVNYPPATTTGLCGAVTYSQNSGTFFPIGTTTVTATTAAGPSCSFTVTVVDNTAPTITCPANITVNNTPGLCSAVVTYPNPTISDNCPFGGGTPTTVTQNSSNTVVAGSVACNSGGLHTDNSYWRAFPLALSGPFTINTVKFGIELANASGTGTTQPVTVRLHTSAGAFPGGARTLIASQTYNIPDQTLSLYTATLSSPPTVPGNAILVLEIFTPSGQAAGHSFFIGSNAAAETAPSYISAAACGIANPVTLASLGFPNMHTIIFAEGLVANPTGLITQIAGLPSGSTFPVGVTTNTFSVTDAAGNSSTCSFNVTVVDNQAPTLTCPSNITQNTDVGACVATVATPNPVNTDNCAVTTLTWSITDPLGGVTNSPATGINYVGTRPFILNGTTGTGTSTVTYTAKDAAGNTSTCSFTVRVNDAWIPVISSQPANQFVCVGSDGAFTVSASVPAGNPLTYQWQTWTGPSGIPANTWVDITGATAATLPLPAVQFIMNTSDYRCVLTGRCSVVISGYATLYVNPLPTISLLASRPLALLPGQLLNIAAVVSPGGGSYQWYKNGVAMAGATGSSLNNLSVDDIGSYTCVYTDLNGCKKTSAVMVVTGEASDKIWVYPNPNTGQFQVRFFNATNDAVSLNIFNSAGQKVWAKAMTIGLPYSKIDVDISNLAADTYTAQIVNGSGKIVGSKKFVYVHQ